MWEPLRPFHEELQVLMTQIGGCSICTGPIWRNVDASARSHIIDAPFMEHHSIFHYDIVMLPASARLAYFLTHPFLMPHSDADRKDVSRTAMSNWASWFARPIDESDCNNSLCLERQIRHVLAVIWCHDRIAHKWKVLLNPISGGSLRIPRGKTPGNSVAEAYRTRPTFLVCGKDVGKKN